MATKPAVCGIDFGASESYVAYVGKGIVDIVQNEAYGKNARKKGGQMVNMLDGENVGKCWEDLMQSFFLRVNDMNRCASMALKMGCFDIGNL